MHVWICDDIETNLTLESMGKSFVGRHHHPTRPRLNPQPAAYFQARLPNKCVSHLISSRFAHYGVLYESKRVKNISSYISNGKRTNIDNLNKSNFPAIQAGITKNLTSILIAKNCIQANIKSKSVNSKIQ